MALLSGIVATQVVLQLHVLRHSFEVCTGRAGVVALEERSPTMPHPHILTHGPQSEDRRRANRGKQDSHLHEAASSARLPPPLLPRLLVVAHLLPPHRNIETAPEAEEAALTTVHVAANKQLKRLEVGLDCWVTR